MRVKSEVFTADTAADLEDQLDTFFEDEQLRRRQIVSYQATVLGSQIVATILFTPNKDSDSDKDNDT